MPVTGIVRARTGFPGHQPLTGVFILAKKGVRMAIKLLILTLLYYGCTVVGSLAAGLGDVQQPADPGKTALAVLLVSFLSILVLSYPIVKSKWTGLRLVFVITLIIFGIRTFLTQIETLVFLRYLVDIVPAEMVPGLFLEGAVVAVLFAPLAVLVHGKFRQERQVFSSRQNIGPERLLWKLLVLGLIYLIIYILFGLFVFLPLAGEAFAGYYAGLKMPFWIFPFQVLRGMVWGMLAIPVINMMKGEWWEKGAAVSLLFSVLMGALLLLPNEFMPETIRMAHFYEVLTSNFVFGWIAALILRRRHTETLNFQGRRW